MADKNTFESDAYMKAAANRIRRSLWLLDKWENEGMANTVRITQLVIHTPFQTGERWRAMIKGRDETGQPFVTWVYGDGSEDLINNIAQRGEVVGFKWRVDEPYDPEKHGKGK